MPGVQAALLLNQLSASMSGKAVGDGSCHSSGSSRWRSVWLQPDPHPGIAAIWGVTQWMEDLSLCVCFSVSSSYCKTLPLKQKQSVSWAPCFLGHHWTFLCMCPILITHHPHQMLSLKDHLTLDLNFQNCEPSLLSFYWLFHDSDKQLTNI